MLKVGAATSNCLIGNKTFSMQSHYGSLLVKNCGSLADSNEPLHERLWLTIHASRVKMRHKLKISSLITLAVLTSQSNWQHLILIKTDLYWKSGTLY